MSVIDTMPTPTVPLWSDEYNRLTSKGISPSAPDGGKNIATIMLGNQERAANPVGTGLADLGSVLGNFSSGEKADRVVRGNYTQNYDQMMLNNELQKNQLGLNTNNSYIQNLLQAQQQRGTQEGNDLRKLQQSSYVAGGGHPYAAPTIQLADGKSLALPTFGFEPKAPSTESMAGATALRDTLQGRLQNNDYAMPEKFTPNFNVQPHPLESYTQPGTAEKIGSYGGAISGILGALGTGGESSLLSKIPGLGKLFGAGGNAATVGSDGMAAGTAGAGGLMGTIGSKALPIAGAALGTYGLMKNRGLGTNVMNGASAGASIGSIVPGLGTAVGGGIGALVGGVRSLFHGGPSDEEKQGRTQAGQVRSAMAATASPQQQAEAAKAGWGNKQGDALALIVLRDNLIKSGMDPKQADQTAQQQMNSLFQSEKSGSVGQAVDSMTQLLNSRKTV